jgi:hypothetical protein
VVGKDELPIQQQPADQGRFPVIDRTASEKAQQPDLRDVGFEMIRGTVRSKMGVISVSRPSHRPPSIISAQCSCIKPGDCKVRPEIADTRDVA